VRRTVWTLAACLAFTSGALVACAALEHDALVIAPGLQAGCSFLESASGNDPWVDFACMGAEAADKLVAAFPAGSASKVASNTLIAPDGGAIATTYRVRLRVAAFVADAGGQ
jgi:hypothetical protein